MSEQSTFDRSERFSRGWDRLSEIDGEAGRRVLESLADVAPDFGRYIVEFAFGDVYSRPGLDIRRRQLVTIAALTTLGGAEPQLAVHINAALNVGLSAACSQRCLSRQAGVRRTRCSPRAAR
jgi:4-carboxymuconolactone decarboxylase